MSAIVLAMALAAQPAPAAPIEAPPGPARPSEAPSEASNRPRPMLPFESGYLAFTMRGWANGTTQCSATGGGAAFVTAAAEFCPDLAGGRESAGEGDPSLILTMVFGIVPEGAAEGLATEWPGRRLFDAEAQITVAPDGRIVACNMIRQEGDVRIAFGDEPLCNDLKRGPPAIHAAPPGAGPRRGRLRIAAFVDGPQAESLVPDVQR